MWGWGNIDMIYIYILNWILHVILTTSDCSAWFWLRVLASTVTSRIEKRPQTQEKQCKACMDKHLYIKAHFHTLIIQAQLSISSPSDLIALSPEGSSGTESTGGSQWTLSAAQGPPVGAQRTSLLLSPSRNPSQLYSELCLLLLFPLRFLKRPQWPLS